MKQNKKPVGRPKSGKQLIRFWCRFTDKERIKKFIETLDKK